MTVEMKAFTTFGAGAAADSIGARTLQPLPSSIVSVLAVDVPAGANPSKLGTWIQQCALGGDVSPEVPADLVDRVRVAAQLLMGDPSVALAIDMTGNPAGEKMGARLGGAPGDRPWLVFGLVPVG